MFIFCFAGVNEKTLAEFIISLHDQSKSLTDFKTKLKDNGAPFPDSVVENMDRLILSMHPKHKTKKRSTTAKDKPGITERDKNIRMFPGLAMPDQNWEASPLSKEAKVDILNQEVQDLMSQLESIPKKVRPRASEFMDEDPKDRSPKRQRLESESENNRGRRQSPPRPSRERSRSPPRYGGNSSYDRDRRRERSPRGRQPIRAVDERPVLYKIYNGKVNSIKEFGAFVTLEGVKGRVDGEFENYLDYEVWLKVYNKVWSMFLRFNKERELIPLLTC